MNENLRPRCVDGPGCAGTVTLRNPIGVRSPLPRCDRHWQQRLNAQERFETLYETARAQDKPASAAHCLACGAPLESALSYTGSLRCLDCRESNAPLDPILTAAWRTSGAGF